MGTTTLVIYIDKFFWNKICQANKDNITYPLKDYFQSGLKEGHQEVIEKLKAEISYEEDHPWWKVFEEELKQHPEIIYVELPF